MENIPVVSYVYKLIVGTYWYIGSATENPSKRIKGHYEQSIKTPDRKLYKYIAENGGWNKVKMEILSLSYTRTLEELRNEENALIKLDDPHCLNSSRAKVSEEEKKRFDQYPSYQAKKGKYQEKKKDPVAWAEDQKKRKERYEILKQDPEWIKAENARKAEYKRRNREQKKLKSKVAENQLILE